MAAETSGERSAGHILPPPSICAQCANETLFHTPQSLRCSSHPSTLLHTETVLFQEAGKLRSLQATSLGSLPPVLSWQRRGLPLLRCPAHWRAYGLFRHSASNKPVASHSTRAPASASPELADGRARRHAGTDPLPRALAGRHARCSRTTFAGAVSLIRALAVGHARSSGTNLLAQLICQEDSRTDTREAQEQTLLAVRDEQHATLVVLDGQDQGTGPSQSRSFVGSSRISTWGFCHIHHRQTTLTFMPPFSWLICVWLAYSESTLQSTR